MGFQNWIALVLCFTASALFGTTFVPIKRYNPRDGLFAQWVMCSAIWFVGFFMFLWTGYQHFYPLAMLGGVSWALGNLMAVPIIAELGLGLSLLLFSVMNTLSCFVVSTFGLLGTNARPSEHMWLNIIGLLLVLVGGVITSFVKSKPAVDHDEPKLSEPMPLNSEKSLYTLASESSLEETKLPNPIRRYVAIFFSLVSGVLYGLNCLPIVAIQDHPEYFAHVEVGGMPYIFSHFCGILCVSTAAFIIYCLVKRNEPYINPRLAMPSVLAGIMWGLAQAMTIIAMEHLSQAISGPITAMVPGCVATMWSLFYFKEIETGANLRVLWTAILVTVSGAVCIGLSKMDF